jgi:DNA-binding MarR family transcriptional regulator
VSRGSRSETRTDAASRTPEPRTDRAASARTPRVPMDGLSLPRTETRERVVVHDHVYHLRGSEARTLATVGAFRLVPAEQLDERRGEFWSGDLQRLDAQGLIERKTITVNQQPMHLVVLTREGQALLAAKQDQDAGRPRQQYHAGLVKPREAAHDAQLHRLFQAEGARIEASGGRIERVVLDYELKRDYQTFLNRRDRPADATTDTDMRVFAAAQGLSVVGGHLELPDLRIEYETEDGRHESRDVELVTEHYSRAQLAGKAQAGFSLYRAAGTGRLGAGGARQGGTPVDPHHLEWLG